MFDLLKAGTNSKICMSERFLVMKVMRMFDKKSTKIRNSMGGVV